ncbi:MAG TPA: class I SAM-dependent methyltransferase [Terriglobales bacterium]|nr:class I SAM-dependent methyltransferase [Terriglobales bacterium]
MEKTAETPFEATAGEDLAHLAENADLLCCPACGGDLQVRGGALACLKCGHSFKCEKRIASLFWPNQWDKARGDVTEIEQSFYERNPFPNYDDTDSVATLVDKARAGIFAHLLDQQVPARATILEVGCGTGQLSNFLASSSRARTVFGADLSLSSLKLGEAFRRAHQINNLTFCQMNLFRPAFKAGGFDLVISNGVLHHTSDPRAAFASIARLVRPRGFIAIGLYNVLGRLPTDARRLLLRMLGDRFAILDPRLRSPELNAARRRAWFLDQYKNPHESKHSFGEVLGWFDTAGFEFMSSIPASDGAAVDSAYRLFEAHPRGSALDRLAVQLRMLLEGGKDGGLFVMIGRNGGHQAGD